MLSCERFENARLRLDRAGIIAALAVPEFRVVRRRAELGGLAFQNGLVARIEGRGPGNWRLARIVMKSPGNIHVIVRIILWHAPPPFPRAARIVPYFDRPINSAKSSQRR
jgi:hypothetical protein